MTMQNYAGGLREIVDSAANQPLLDISATSVKRREIPIINLSDAVTFGQILSIVGEGRQM
jgi:lipoprotein signal peptidase